MKATEKVEMEGSVTSVPMARRNMVPQVEETYPPRRYFDDVTYDVDTVSMDLPDGTKQVYYVNEQEIRKERLNGKAAESETQQGNQKGNGQGGKLMETVDDKVENDSQMLDFQEELYGSATAMSLNPAALSVYPKLEDVEYEISCTECTKAVGPPKIACAYGHTICDSCYDNLEDPTKCKTMVGDEHASNVCGGTYYAIDESIQNTPYYKYFLEVSKYACFAEGLGCEFISSGKDVDNHEKRQCPYRFVKYCGYRNAEINCEATFAGWASHIKHLIEAHGVPVYLGAEGHFMVKYDREEFRNAATVDKEVDVIPLVRAVHGGEEKDFLITLMVKELGDHQTRVWFLDTRADDTPEIPTRYVASLCIHPKREGHDGEIDKDWINKTFSKDLAVMPSIKTLANLEENPKDEEGMDYYLDLDNSLLDGIAVTREGQKYFILMTSIAEKKRGTTAAAEDATEQGVEVVNENGSTEALNGAADEKGGDGGDEKMEGGEVD